MIPETTSQQNLPEGYTKRPLTMDDAKAVIALIETNYHYIDYDSQPDLESLLSEWKEPNFNLEQSSLAIHDGDGQLVACGVVWDNASLPVRPWYSWDILPSLYDTSLAAYVLQWFEATAQRVFQRVPDDARVVLQSGVLARYSERIQALKDAGFQHTRNFYRMEITMDAPPPIAQLPAHIEIRCMEYPEEIPMVAELVADGFRDHWGYVEEPLDEEIKFWEHHLANDELFDPSLYFIAFDTENNRPAGAALCRIEQVGKPENAYVEELAVLPAYRRQGIALALLHHTFGVFYERERFKVALHVDADSLTGATRLYERAGMTPDESWQNYQKVLRDGVELSTTSVD